MHFPYGSMKTLMSLRISCQKHFWVSQEPSFTLLRTWKKLVGISPLNLLHEQIINMFLLKCMYHGDGVAGRILQVECLPHHPFNNCHIRLTKEFLQYTNGLDSRLSHTPLTMFDREKLIYGTNKILEYTCRKYLIIQTKWISLRQLCDVS
jgi:hypothetical protein